MSGDVRPDIEIPESAVEAAVSAYDTNNASDHCRANDSAMQAALRAALAEMLEPVGFTNSEEFAELKAGRGGWVSGLELDRDTITIYRIKGPQ